MGSQLRARGRHRSSERILPMISKDLLGSICYTPPRSPWQISFLFMDLVVDQGRRGARQLIPYITGRKSGFLGMLGFKVVVSIVLDTWQTGTTRKTVSWQLPILRIHYWAKSTIARRSEKLMSHLRAHEFKSR